MLRSVSVDCLKSTNRILGHGRCKTQVYDPPAFPTEAAPTLITSCGSDESLNTTSVVDLVALWYPFLRHLFG